MITANSPTSTTNFASAQQTTFVQGGSNGQTGNGFIVAGTNTVATIGAAARGAEIVSIL
jgi:hypothetical protein